VLTRLRPTCVHEGIALPGGRSAPTSRLCTRPARSPGVRVGMGPSSSLPAWLSPIVTFAFGFGHLPVVGLLAKRPVLVIDPAEG